MFDVDLLQSRASQSFCSLELDLSVMAFVEAPHRNRDNSGIGRFSLLDVELADAFDEVLRLQVRELQELIGFL